MPPRAASHSAPGISRSPSSLLAAKVNEKASAYHLSSAGQSARYPEPHRQNIVNESKRLHSSISRRDVCIVVVDLVVVHRLNIQKHVPVSSSDGSGQSWQY
ncbi:uncharacterized protein BO96DRAFT_399831 [Aspergillus niger CBS 101883]|uniref:Contig An07c0230, genomic contig n=2 Tax=Aspergillus niger TaxID=5061 RepID=A2QP34_ASPNC|nr:uncharacterized protein BO96DRAFT_399831 [Aspergillus niger CBS 101883]XP_059601033.1 uncharacterized protein An07g08050 [Aspergillus niger]PYH53374.1 hypothetical protein BO96DRAFT_399831 [Aspergillus niger CBS 101883]CAK39621.1 unnamed protein product [Aspergillus niger]